MWKLFKAAAVAWSDDNAPMHAAALSYYTAFSIAPLIVIAVAVTGLLFGETTSSGAVFNTLASLLGENGARAIQAMTKAAGANRDGGIVATVLGLVTLLIGASGVFTQLQQSLDFLWKARPKPGRSLATILRQRVLSFSMVAVVAFLLLVSLLVSAALAAAEKFVGDRLPGGGALWHLANAGVSIAVITFLFAAIYKILPDVKLAWRDVGIGAFATAILFTAGKFLIGLYLGKSSVASAYGAAGSLVVLLLWVYYSSIIMLFGAELTRVYALRGGRRVELKENAEYVRLAPVNELPRGRVA
ncbi:MAG: YihY/virulence factor BrkB family protein [Deltaproteobacteria bacterium]|nr:YihY/virulence factor BrkB family protein [Deltaproteobacteria bacterium]